jgi:hypothetical protein
MDVFIGNATKQLLQFAYRVAERKGPIVQIVPVLSQIKLSWDFTPHDVDALFEHWSQYGLVDVTEMHSVREGFEGYLASVGKPIAVDNLVLAHEKHNEVLDQHGQEIREQAAIVIEEEVHKQSGMPPNTFEISVAEEIPEHGFTDSNKHVAEGFRLQRGPNAPPPDPKRRRWAENLG